MQPRVCHVCRNLNDPRAGACWVCYSPLPAMAQPPPHASVAPSTDGRGSRLRDGSVVTAFGLIGWLVLLGGMGLTVLLVGFELAREWPGLLIPFALVQLVMFAALGRTVWMHGKATIGSGPADARPADAMTQRVTFVVSMALVGASLLVLLAVAAFVIFMVICLAVVMGSAAMS